MIAYKGVNPDGTNRLGKGTILFEVGKTYMEERSKTVAAGFHCCENPFECLSYYNLGKDRFFMVDARGDIDEDENERVACTEIEILKELTVKEFILAGLSYMVSHQKREGWEKSVGKDVKIAKDVAIARLAAIARGKNPTASAGEGGYIALVGEDTNGYIWAVRMKKIDGKAYKPGVMYKLSFAGEVVPA